MALIIGTAGWAIPAAERSRFSSEGSGLQRYASVLNGVEVNSSFYRPHRRSTWARWAESVPDDFRFSVKMPKEISHQRKLRDCEKVTEVFLEEVSGLGGRLAVLLLQLPPKLAFDEASAGPFLAYLAEATQAQIACEPRHPSWFEEPVAALLKRLGVARVGADPAPVPDAAEPGGWRGLRYLRLHGSPEMYRSSYPEERLRQYAELLAADGGGAGTDWCIFDNTAASAAMTDALALRSLSAP